jgi:hypothetical protein
LLGSPFWYHWEHQCLSVVFVGCCMHILGCSAIWGLYMCVCVCVYILEIYFWYLLSFQINYLVFTNSVVWNLKPILNFFNFYISIF